VYVIGEGLWSPSLLYYLIESSMAFAEAPETYPTAQPIDLCDYCKVAIPKRRPGDPESVVEIERSTVNFWRVQI
jgi:hypothetical protein